MNTKTIRVAAGFGALTLVAAACSSGHKAAASAPASTSSSSSSTLAPTTTTAPARFPLTGLPAPSTQATLNPAVVVKVDNVDAARPQVGVQDADIVYEAEVEGGLTRLAPVFQSDYPTDVGPVRSGRLTDEGVADDLNHPVLAFAGANAIFLPILEAQPVTVVDIDNYPNQFQRVGNNAPHNLFANVASLAALSSTHTGPPPLFDYLAPGQSFTGAGVTPAAGVSIPFPSVSASWSWDASSGKWLRTQDGTPDVVSSGAQIAATNVVIYYVNYISSGIASGEGVPDTEIPEGILTGTGPVWVFSDGKLVEGTWNRSSLTSVATYTDSSGATIRLTPGNTWIELAPAGTVATVTP